MSCFGKCLSGSGGVTDDTVGCFNNKGKGEAEMQQKYPIKTTPVPIIATTTVMAVSGPKGGTSGTAGCFINKSQQEFVESEFNTGAQNVPGSTNGVSGTTDSFINEVGATQKISKTTFNTGANTGANFKAGANDTGKAKNIPKGN